LRDSSGALRHFAPIAGLSSLPSSGRRLARKVLQTGGTTAHTHRPDPADRTDHTLARLGWRSSPPVVANALGRLGLTSDQPGQDKSRTTPRTDRAGRTASLQRIGLASPRQDPCSPRHLAGAHPQGDDPVAPGRPLRGAAWHSQQQPAVVQLYSTCTAHVVAQQAAPRAAILAAAGYSFSTGYV
jgi:hypothetical protein